MKTKSEILAMLVSGTEKKGDGEMTSKEALAEWGLIR
jgi:hypothetical protein